jgi:hypothetical protein
VKDTIPMTKGVLRALALTLSLAAPGCTVDAVVGVAGSSDGGSDDGIHLVSPGGEPKDASPDGAPPLAGPSIIACSNNDDCPASAFCWAASECPTEKAGECAITPSTCSTEHEPVCGCDGKTYANRCLAYKARTSVRQVGDCS